MNNTRRSIPTGPAVLIVEDQASMRVALRDFLRMTFPQDRVFEAETISVAIALFEQHQPALVLMDICLPDGNGLDLTRRFLASRPDTVIAVMSIQTGPHIAEQARAAGAASFIGKDRIFIDLKPLLASVHRPAP